MTRVVRINGPLFFAAAERIFAELSALTPEDKYLILQWDAVPVLDAGGLQAFMQFCNKLPASQHVLVTYIPFQPLKTLAWANVMPIADRLSFCSTLPQALEYLSAPPAADALAVGQGR
ncbi:STAS domain-containing protein [Candidatus Sodalis pierantonius]|uniref:STAS domain-containing protein n=1 Tax=Candidatus Sodalis pierantonii TaxID=1486991 RepID=UPI001F3AF33F|nr:STAS domain-containing protein [Candidatus Sodalis pierantonius]